MADRLLAVVQARMSSRRFPGKVLAPFRGEPIVAHVLRTVTAAVDGAPVVLATSVETSDDPLALYGEALGYPVVRGALDDVVARFRMCLDRFPADWVLRVSADSPMIDGAVIRKVIAAAGPGVDLVTTIHPRTFPKGTNAEVMRVERFLAIPGDWLTPADREHVTSVYYRRPDDFRIVNVASGRPALASESVAVDTLEDLARLEEPWAGR